MRFFFFFFFSAMHFFLFFSFFLAAPHCLWELRSLIIEPGPPAVGAQSPNHCGAREFLAMRFYRSVGWF